MNKLTPILNPLTLPKGAVLKNRLVMAPMTTCTGYFDGGVTSDLVEYYRVRAGSIGTVIVECCFIDNRGPAFPGALGIDSDNKIAGLAKIAHAIKSEGSKAILQIYHGGRMVEPALIGGKTPVAPSAIAAPRDGATKPQALTAEEVDVMITKFGDAVNRAIKAGFDGVEIHGANTYLIQQFYSLTPTSATTNGAAAAITAHASQWKCWRSPIKWPIALRRQISSSVIVSHRKSWKSPVSVGMTRCIC